jgi:hypothetical protein
MRARLRTRWTVEIFDNTAIDRRSLSTRHFDRFTEVKDHLDQHKEHRFVVYPPTAVHSDDLCALDDLRRSGFNIERL